MTSRRVLSSSGFTLIELMLVVALIGILSTMAVANLQKVKRTSDHNAVARGVFSALGVGRAHAVRKNQRVAVSFSNSQFRAFVDNNSDLIYTSGIDTSLWVYPTSGAIPTGITVTSPQLTSANVQLAALFDAQGTSVDKNGQPFSYNVCIVDETTNYTYTVETTVSGSLRINRITGAACPSAP